MVRYLHTFRRAHTRCSSILSPKIDLMPHDLITQLLRVLAIETKQEKAMVQADPTELSLSGLEAFSFDYVVKWPLSLIINRWVWVAQAPAPVSSFRGEESGVPAHCIVL